MTRRWHRGFPTLPPSGAGRAVLILLVACHGADSRPPAGSRSPFFTADSLRDEGRFAQMLPRYRELRDSFASAGDTANLWRAQLWWSEGLIRNQRRDSARVALTETMALARGDRDREGWTRWRWCGLYSGLGQSDSAISECQRAIELGRATGDQQLEAEAHNQLGTVQSRRGHYRESLNESEHAVALWRQGHFPAGELSSFLNNLAIEYYNQGRLGEADRAYREGLALAESGHSPRTAYFIKGNLAEILAGTGEVDEAERLMQESLEAAEAFPDTSSMAYANNSLAEYFLGVGNLQLARRHLERALAISDRVVVFHRMTTLLGLGTLALAEADSGEAATWLERSRDLADRSDFGRQRVLSRTGLARLALLEGKPTTGLRWAEAAVRIADSLGDIRAQLDAMQTRAAVLEALRRSEASGLYLRTIDLLESWRGRLAVGDLRMGLADSYWGVYEGAIRSLFARGRAADAFNIAERARARLLLELLADRDASRTGRSPLDLLRNRLRVRYQERDAVEEPAEQAALDREMTALTDSLAELEAGARRGDPLAAARYPSPASLPDLRAGLLRPGRGLLTWFWGDSAAYGWWVTSGTLRGARLGSADSLAALVDFLRQNIESPAPGVPWEGAARQAFLRFVAPLGALDADEILVVPDGPLAQIPIEIFIPPGQSQPWAGRLRFVYGPSASVLRALARAPAEATWERAVLAVGNPAPNARPPGTPVDDAVLRSGEFLGPLPFAEEEARGIRDLFRDGGADLLVGPAATVANWTALDPSRYRYLHFATHALVSDRIPERTGLVLSGSDLNLAAIRRLSLHSELVSLSACETALGRRVRGEGIIGLSHAFLAAGAHGVVVTLWRVQDRSSSEFMRGFYQELRNGVTPAEALRIVRQRWISAVGEDGQPSRWAAFVLVGGVSGEAVSGKP